MNPRLVTILVIEDDQREASLLRSLLDYRWDGRFRMIHLEDLATGLDYCSTNSVDVILLDLSLPDSQGLDGFLQFYARAPHVPIVVLSGTNDEGLAMKAVQAGAQDYLVKGDLNDHLLVRSVRYAIERSGREHAEEALRLSAAQFQIARDIQQRLFPGRAPELPGFDMAGVSYPADETGGDYFDYIPMPEGTLGVVVGDVSSHGLGPALLMAETRAYLRALAVSDGDVGQILTRTNQILADDAGGRYFVTLMLGRIDPRRRSFDYAGAGHAGFLMQPSGEATPLPSTSLPLGILRDHVVAAAPRIVLQAGQVVLMWTDGIAEAESPQRELFGADRALDVVRSHLRDTATQIIDALHHEVVRFTAGRPQADDITAVAIKVTAEA